MNCNDQTLLNTFGKQFDKIALRTTVQIDKCNHFQGSYLFINTVHLICCKECIDNSGRILLGSLSLILQFIATGELSINFNFIPQTAPTIRK